MTDLEKKVLFKQTINHYFAVAFVVGDALEAVKAETKKDNLSEGIHSFLKELESSLVCIQKHVIAGMEEFNGNSQNKCVSEGCNERGDKA